MLKQSSKIFNTNEKEIVHRSFTVESDALEKLACDILYYFLGAMLKYF